MKLRSSKSYGSEVDLLTLLNKVRHRAVKRTRRPTTKGSNLPCQSPTSLDEAERKKRLADRPIQSPPLQTNLADDDLIDELLAVTPEARKPTEDKSHSSPPKTNLEGWNFSFCSLSPEEVERKKRLAESRSSSQMRLPSLKTDTYGAYFDYEDCKLLGIEVPLSYKEYAEEQCQVFMEYINQMHAPIVYELVEALSCTTIMVRGLWFHANLRARRRTPAGSDDSSAELFFVEINGVKGEITSFKSLEHSGDAPPPVKSCRFCRPDFELIVYHPGDGDFYLPAS